MQIHTAGGVTNTTGTDHYSNGYWWRARVSADAEEQGLPMSDIGLFLEFELPPGMKSAPSGLCGAAAVGPAITMTLSVASAQAGAELNWWKESETARDVLVNPLSDGANWGFTSFPLYVTL